jgi:hypothetical protein
LFTSRHDISSNFQAAELALSEFQASEGDSNETICVDIGGNCDTSDQITRAKDVLKNTGAGDISSTGESSADVKTHPQVRHTTSGGKA